MHVSGVGEKLSPIGTALPLTLSRPIKKRRQENLCTTICISVSPDNSMFSINFVSLPWSKDGRLRGFNAMVFEWDWVCSNFDEEEARCELYLNTGLELVGERILEDLAGKFRLHFIVVLQYTPTNLGHLHGYVPCLPLHRLSKMRWCDSLERRRSDVSFSFWFRMSRPSYSSAWAEVLGLENLISLNVHK